MNVVSGLGLESHRPGVMCNPEIEPRTSNCLGRLCRQGNWGKRNLKPSQDRPLGLIYGSMRLIFSCQICIYSSNIEPFTIFSKEAMYIWNGFKLISTNTDLVNRFLLMIENKIQCIVANQSKHIGSYCPFPHSFDR